jgi:glucokinase
LRSRREQRQVKKSKIKVTKFMHRILAADIGGTNSRFAAFESDLGGQLVMRQSCWLPTDQAESFPHLIEQLHEEDFELPPEKADITVLAVAGPVTDGIHSDPPNIKWDVDVSDLPQKSGFGRCKLINDFAAQAYACRSPVIKSAQLIVAGKIDPEAALVVVGAGTGLGQAALINDGCGRWLAVSSEGGHAGFPFETEDERDYEAFLRQQTGDPYIEAETVVSGRGLSNLHHFLTGRKLKPSEVGDELGEDSPTVIWMSRFYGRVCRNYALQLLAYGGVYIAGGVAAKLPQLVTCAEFEASFRSSSTMAGELKKIPVFLNANEESGLWGAAFYGQQQLINP